MSNDRFFVLYYYEHRLRVKYMFSTHFFACKNYSAKMVLCQSIHNFYDNNTHTQKRMYRLYYNLCISKMYCLGNKMTQIDLNFTKLGRWNIVITTTTSTTMTTITTTHSHSILWQTVILSVYMYLFIFFIFLLNNKGRAVNKQYIYIYI